MSQFIDVAQVIAFLGLKAQQSLLDREGMAC